MKALKIGYQKNIPMDMTGAPVIKMMMCLGILFQSKDAIRINMYLIGFDLFQFE